MIGQHILRDKIVSCICEMDMRLLDVLLPDDGVYENTYKEIWLGKLSAFLKACALDGDTSLKLTYGKCQENQNCSCGNETWIFEASQNRKYFAISFLMDGDNICGIERCYASNIIDNDTPTFCKMENNHAFTIYDDEKIGFIADHEFRQTKKDVETFIIDIGNPSRRFVGPLWLKRKTIEYNPLYFRVEEQPHHFEYKNEMLKIYQDILGLRNIFAQQKTYRRVLEKYKDMRDAIDTKDKILAVKLLMMNMKTISQFLISHYELTIYDGKFMYAFKIDDALHGLYIRHPKIKMDIDACIEFQTNVGNLFDFFTMKYIEEIKVFPSENQKGLIYVHFMDRIGEMMEEFEGCCNVGQR